MDMLMHPCLAICMSPATINRAMCRWLAARAHLAHSARPFGGGWTSKDLRAIVAALCQLRGTLDLCFIFSATEAATISWELAQTSIQHLVYYGSQSCTFPVSLLSLELWQWPREPLENPTGDWLRTRTSRSAFQRMLDNLSQPLPQLTFMCVASDCSTLCPLRLSTGKSANSAPLDACSQVQQQPVAAHQCGARCAAPPHSARLPRSAPPIGAAAAGHHTCRAGPQVLAWLLSGGGSGPAGRVQHRARLVVHFVDPDTRLLCVPPGAEVVYCQLDADLASTASTIAQEFED